MNNCSRNISIFLDINRLRTAGDIKKAIDLLVNSKDEFGVSCEFCMLLSDLFFSIAITSRGETGENYQKAIDWLKVAIDKDFSNSRLHSKLGDIYWLGMLDYSSAEEEYRHAIKFDPNNQKAYIGLAALYGSPDSSVTAEEAINCIAALCEIEPDNPANYARLGELLFKEGRKTEAHHAWLRALSCSSPLEKEFVAFINDHLT